MTVENHAICKQRVYGMRYARQGVIRQEYSIDRPCVHNIVFAPNVALVPSFVYVADKSVRLGGGRKSYQHSGSRGIDTISVT